MTKTTRLVLIISGAIGAVYWFLLMALTASGADRMGSTRTAIQLGLEFGGLAAVLGLGRVLNARLFADAKAAASKDELTGLPNRSAFLERLEEAMARSTRSGRMVAVLFLDLDRFKLVNDTLGHGAGDRLLVEVSRRLRRQVRSGEIVARLGGDEFTFLLEGLANQRGAETMAQRLLSTLDGSTNIDGHDVSMSASIGIAVNLGRHCPPDELVRRADVALYQAKADGRGCWRSYQPGTGPSALERLELDAGLRKAIQRNELLLYFQPIVDLSSGRIDGFEALVRWQHPSRGLLLPLAFIPMAEEAGLIRAIGQWVILEACREAVRWQEDFPDLAPLSVSVNLSPLEFRERDLVSEVAEVLSRTGLEPGFLKLEIVETALMQDVERTATMLHGFRQLGVRLAIDDFGTGYSSLSYLRRFPVDTLKIDRSFVLEAMQDHSARAIIESVVTLAHALGINVTAEGVETRDQLAFLMDAKCDHAQGYLFARPLPREAVLHFLAAQQPALTLTAAYQRAA